MNREVVQGCRQRAKDRCEYCHLPAIVYPLPFHVDHIVARQHGGKTVLENLALACLHCNRHKGPNIAGTDPNTGPLLILVAAACACGQLPGRDHSTLPSTPEDLWSEHFEWMGAVLGGRTAIGRATIHVLAINGADFLAMRKALIEEQVFPLE